jgi:hypothetical protein
MTRLLSCGLAAALFVCGNGVLAIEYRFTNIADYTTAAPIGTFDQFLPPAISGGTVAFWGRYQENDEQELFEGIFAGSGGAITTIAKSGDVGPSGEYRYEFGNPAISEGTVAFRADVRRPAGSIVWSGVLTGSGGPLTTIAQTGDPAPIDTFQNFGDPTIDGTTVAFRGRYFQQWGIFIGSGGPLTTIVKEGDPAPAGTSGFDAFGDPAISGDTLAFVGAYSDFGAIFVGDEDSLTPIVTQGDAAPSATFQGFDEPALSGESAAFWSRFGPSQVGIFAGNGKSIMTIAKEGDTAAGGTLIGFSLSSISGNTVAFVGNLGGRSALSTGNGDQLNSVIMTGDELFGSTATILHFGRLGLDPGGSGNLAFAYSLANGRSGIAIATPVREPSASWALLFLAGTYLMSRSGRKKFALT